MKNMEKRKRIMTRSIRLGHCICDPQKPCPCDLFKEQDLCLCAGERPESPTGPVKLTRIVEKAGCASKIDQVFLKQVLRDLPVADDPRVLVGVPAGDDAGIYDMGDGKAIVQTVDVFTPSVDDPYTFGQVAAANSVSDVYAMGGKPITALSVIGFPARKIPDNVMTEILRGGIDKMKEANVAVIGGHSINDSEIKAGFAVTGTIDLDKVKLNATAKPGDRLILTKPLGVGIVAFATQIERAKPESTEATAKSMTTLNKTASELMVEFGANACTDVTGFSLMGHLAEMARSSKVDVEITWDNLPLFPHVTQYAADGILPGAIERNKESCAHYVTAGDNITQEMLDICFDAQTSGGLLIAIAETDADKFLAQLHAKGVTDATAIGKILGKGTGKINVITNNTRQMPAPTPRADVPKPAVAAQPAPQPESQETPCCAADATATPQAENHDHGDTAEIQQKFAAFMQTVNKPAGLDAYTKQAMSIALSVLAKCEPCLKSQIKKAKQKGFTQQEIDEAAWMGIAFGGAPVMMFYKTACG